MCAAVFIQHNDHMVHFVLLRECGMRHPKTGCFGMQRTDAASKDRMRHAKYVGSKYHWATRNTALLKDEIATAAKNAA
jgi:hypothetical protein